jgi:hypothetical protein
MKPVTAPAAAPAPAVASSEPPMAASAGAAKPPALTGHARGHRVVRQPK